MTTGISRRMPSPGNGWWHILIDTGKDKRGSSLALEGEDDSLEEVERENIVPSSRKDYIHHSLQYQTEPN